MDIGAGPWAVKYNDEVIAGVEAADPALDKEETSISGMDGVVYKRIRTRSATVVLKVFGTGIDNLKGILADNWLAAASQILGQPVGTVAKAGGKGVIGFGSVACGATKLLAPLQLVPCDNPDEHTLTLFDGRAEITGMPIEDGIVKLEITVNSEAVGTQMAKGAITFADES